MIRCPQCRCPSYSTRKKDGKVVVYTCNTCQFPYTFEEHKQREERERSARKIKKAQPSGPPCKTYVYEFKPLKRDPDEIRKLAMLVR